VDTLHMTGSNRTHDAIVWGAAGDANEQARRKAAGERQNTKPFTSELGCITPWIVVPGPWTDDDLEFQARQVAASLTGYAGFSCNAGQVVVLAGDWDRREEFLHRLEGVLARHPSKRAWYPGAQARHRAFLEAYPRRAKILGRGGHGCLPWTLIRGVRPTRDEYALSNEAFCGVISAVELPGHAEADTFLPAAVRLANEELWGTLSAHLLIHPQTERRHSVPFDRAVAGLRYGGIAINCWSGANYGLVNPTWGSFPGHTADDIQSGVGVVHNALLLDHPQKSVVRCPWRIQPTPAWFPDHRNLPDLGRRVADLEYAPSWLKVPAIALAALKG
jgi:acyl-CoA reductase-like NAD-dependent aldehyde dehydrogenase